MKIEVLSPLANKFDEKIIWDFLLTRGITQDNLHEHMDELNTTGCNNSDCERSYNDAEQLLFSIDSVGYVIKDNRFIDISNYNYDEINLEEIDILDYFQIYYCPVCFNCEYYIE